MEGDELYQRTSALMYPNEVANQQSPRFLHSFSSDSSHDKDRLPLLNGPPFTLSRHVKIHHGIFMLLTLSSITALLRATPRRITRTLCGFLCAAVFFQEYLRTRL